MSENNIMNIVTNKYGQLIFDECGRVCLADTNGNVCYVPLEMLPANFLQEYSEPSQKAEAESSELSNEKLVSPLPHAESSHHAKSSLFTTVQLHSEKENLVSSPPHATSSQHAGSSLFSLQLQSENETIISPVTQAKSSKHVRSSLSSSSSSVQLQSENDNSVSSLLQTERSQHAESSHSLPVQLQSENELPRIFLWTRNATKYLLHLYKENKENFNNRKIKKDKIWKDITKKLAENGFGNPSQRQVEDKFKNRTYAKIKDSRGPNSSGAPAPERFEYFEDMDEIFGQSPSFNPPLVVGSRRPLDENIATTSNPEKKIKKKSSLLTILDAQEKRHEEILKELCATRAVFAEKLDKLIEKL